MYLKGLELTGFKSFAKKSALEFNAPISAIVGPNGSGKSNVAEAFRFVLGEQSIKSLRGKRGEDLIFNGGNDAPRANRASVKVIFDNTKRFLNIDFDEVTIERVVHRDSINEYLINGSQVRLKDILELLAGAHIGSSGHHIISQGEADKILNANTKERKAMIEDALGLKVYQYKRHESERKLLKTEENIKSVQSLRREIAPHMRFLKKQVEKVEKSIEMKEQLRGLYRDYFKREDEYIKSSRKKLQTEETPLQDSLKKLEIELLKAKEVLSKSDDKNKKSSQIISLEEKIRNVRNEKDILVRDIGRIEGEISSEERIAKKQKELAFSDSHKMVSLKDVEALTSNIDEKLVQLGESDDIGFIKKALKEIRGIFVGFLSKNKTQGNEMSMEESRNEIARLTKEREILQEKISKIKNAEQALDAEYAKLKENIEKEKDSGREAERKIFKIMSEQNEIILKLDHLKGIGDRLRLEEENLKRELSEALVLVGRSALDFSSHVLIGQDSLHISHDDVVKENRGAQEERRRVIEKIKIRLEDAGLGSSEEIMKEHKEVTERDAFLSRELEDLEKSAVSLKQLIIDLENRLNVEFKAGVEKINKQFQEFFSLMFGGGSASLSVVKERRQRRSDTDIVSLLSEEGVGEIEEETAEEKDEAEEGIEIEVNLPRKKIKGLAMLSGGERALTSIALLFAVSQVNPPPFIILDETDAALDEANSKKYGDMIVNLSKFSQLILVTHNRETMSRAGILYGVTMGSGGASKLLSIQFDEAVAVAK